MDTTTIFRNALRYVVGTSVGTVANDAGYSRSLFDGYLNRRPPSKAAVRALSKLLRVRVNELEQHATLLDGVTDEARRGDSA